MVYSCEWPLYLHGPRNMTAIAETCNLWRYGGDLDDSFGGVQYQIRYYGDNQERWAPHIGPGAWNDLDQMPIGNFGLSYDEAKLQFVMWSMLASPLIMATDLTKVSDEMRDVLQHRGVIALNQDPLGIIGKRLKYDQHGVSLGLLVVNSFNQKGIFLIVQFSVYTREVTPVVGGHKSLAIAITNYATIGTTSPYVFTLSDMGLDGHLYTVTDVYDNDRVVYSRIGIHEPIAAWVNPSGVVLLKAILDN